MKWLLDTEVFEEDAEPLIASLQKFNIDHTICKFGIQYDSYINKFANETEPVMFYGCLQFAKQIKLRSNKITVFCNLPKFECTFYYPRFGQHLLNENYIMLPFGELLRRQNWIFDNFGEVVFIRPSSGYKTFPGITIDKSSIEREVKHYSRIVDLHELVIIAPSKNIKNEWRAIIIDGKAITAGQYKKDSKIVRISDVPSDVMDYANVVLKEVKYQPDPAWTLDICETEEGVFKVLEVGSFSCAGLYACDTDLVVTTINSLWNIEDEI